MAKNPAPASKPEPKTIKVEPMGIGGQVKEIPNPKYVEPKTDTAAEEEGK